MAFFGSGEVPAEDPFFPEDMPESHTPGLPDAPTGGNEPIELASGNQTLSQDDTVYELTGDLDTLTIATNATQIRVNGNGFSVTKVVMPVQFSSDGFRDPRCSHIAFHNFTTPGTQGSDPALTVHGSHILFQDVDVLVGTSADYACYSWGADNLTFKDCEFETLGVGAGLQSCHRIVMGYKTASIGGTRTSGSTHSFRLHGKTTQANTLCPDGISRYHWVSDMEGHRPWFIGYSADATEGLDHVIIRRCTVNSNDDDPDGAVFQYAPVAYLDEFEVTDCDFTGSLAVSSLSGFETAADSNENWTYSGNTAQAYP